jgi:hypothetical protein
MALAAFIFSWQKIVESLITSLPLSQRNSKGPLYLSTVINEKLETSIQKH